MRIRTHVFLRRLSAELTRPVPVLWSSIAPGLEPTDSLYRVDSIGVINVDGSMTLRKVHNQIYGPEMPVHRFRGEDLQKVRLSKHINGHRLYLETHMVESLVEDDEEAT